MGVCLSSGSPRTACSAGTSSAFSAALTAQLLKVTTCSELVQLLHCWSMNDHLFQFHLFWQLSPFHIERVHAV